MLNINVKKDVEKDEHTLSKNVEKLSNIEKNINKHRISKNFDEYCVEKCGKIVEYI